MRDLGGDVVSDVGLADAVKSVSSERAEELAVNGAEGSTGKVPLVGGVVG
jgi:hypothetical protein